MACVAAVLAGGRRGVVVKVALVCPYAWDRPGGVQTHVRALARALEERGHASVVLAPGEVGESDTGVVSVGRALGIPANGSVAPIAISPVAAAAVRRTLAAFEPDVVHVHEPLVPAVSLTAVWNAKAPTVGTFHAAAESNFWYGATRGILQRAARRIVIRTAVSEAARELAQRYFPGDYVITPNGVDVARFADAKPLDLGPGRKVGFLGRLEPRKGPALLIEAMARVKGTGARLVVAGSGPLEDDCKKLAEQRGIDATFLGELSEDDVPRFYRSLDVYCSPATGGESFGIVLIEALAAGTPVVCSELDGFVAAVGDAAITFEPESIGHLAEALRRVLQDEPETERLVKAGRLRAASFDWEGLAAGVETVYQQARGGKR
jgi:phosphatidyl-myo-inositol alpha-mannosyltransferase